MAKIYALVNDTHGWNVLCDIIRYFQENIVMFDMAEMRDRQCRYHVDGVDSGLYLQYQNEVESMGLFPSAVELSWTDMPFVQCIVGSVDTSDIGIVRMDK